MFNAVSKFLLGLYFGFTFLISSTAGIAAAPEVRSGARFGLSEIGEFLTSPAAQEVWTEESYAGALQDVKHPQHAPLIQTRQRFSQWLQSTLILPAQQKEDREKISLQVANPLLQQLAFEHFGKTLLEFKYDANPEQCRQIERFIHLVSYLCPSDPTQFIGIEKRWTPLLLIHLFNAYVHDRDLGKGILPCTNHLSNEARELLRDLSKRFANNSHGVISVWGGGGAYSYGRRRFYSGAQRFMAPIFPGTLPPASHPSEAREFYDSYFAKGNKVRFGLIKVSFDTYHFEKEAKQPLASWASWDEEGPLADEKSTLEIYPLWAKRIRPESPRR